MRSFKTSARIRRIEIFNGFFVNIFAVLFAFLMFLLVLSNNVNSGIDITKIFSSQESAVDYTDVAFCQYTLVQSETFSPGVGGPESTIYAVSYYNKEGTVLGTTTFSASPGEDYSKCLTKQPVGDSCCISRLVEKPLDYCDDRALGLTLSNAYQSSSLFSLSLLALVLNFSILGLAYALAELGSASSIKAFVKNEYFEGLKTLAIFAGLVSIFELLNTTAYAFTGEQDFLRAACKQSFTLKDNIKTNVFAPLFQYAFMLGILAPLKLGLGYYFGFGLGKAALSLTVSYTGRARFFPSSIVEWGYPPTKFTLMNRIINDLVYGVEPSFVLAVARPIILTFSKILVFSFFLPLGLLLRGFPVLRKVGGFFISLSIVLLFIYPVLVLLVDIPFINFSLSFIDTEKLNHALQTPVSDIIDSVTVLKTQFSFTNLIKAIFYIIVGIVWGIMAFIFPGVSFGFLAVENLPSLFFVFRASLGGLFFPLEIFLSVVFVNISQMITFVIDIFVVYTFLMDINEIIGGKMTIAGREVRGLGFFRI